MTGFYKEMQGIASDVLRDFNQGVIEYITLSSGNGPIDNPGEPTEIKTTLRGATARTVKSKYVDNTIILGTDIQITFSVQTNVNPEIDDFVKIDGIRYKIIKTMTIPSAGTPVAHMIMVRR